MILRTLVLIMASLMVGCTTAPPDVSRSVPEGRPDFHALGQEPGWLLDIHRGGQTVFEYDYAQKRLVVPTPEPEKMPSGKTLYRASPDGQSLTISIAPAPCRDVMSGKRFDFSVTVVLDGRRFEGCGTRNPEGQTGSGRSD